MKWIGFFACAMIAVAYLPQLYHMYRAKCTAGVNKTAYFMWAVASLALCIYAVYISDVVFILLHGYQLAATTFIFILAVKNGDCKCEEHGGDPADSKW